MRAKSLTETIQTLIKLEETKPTIIGPQLHSSDPNSLMALYGSLGDKKFFDHLYKIFEDTMDDQFGGSFKVEEKADKHDKMTISAHCDVTSDEHGDYNEEVSFVFDKKTGVLTIDDAALMKTGTRPATHLDPQEDITKEFYTSAEIFTAKDLGSLIKKALQHVRKPVEDFERKSSYTKDDYQADRADTARTSGERY